MPEPRVLVFAETASERSFLPRTLRALRHRGLLPIDTTATTNGAWAKDIAGQSVWLVRSGAFPALPGALEWPPPSALDKPLAALGITRQGAFSGQGKRAEAWERLVRQTGGHFSARNVEAFPTISSVYLEPPLVNLVAKHLERGALLEKVLTELLHGNHARIVRFAPLDVYEDEALRVFLVITSLQQGGAEKMVLDLAEMLPPHGIRPRIVTLGRPTRASFHAPTGTISFMHEKDRIAALSASCLEQGADLVHAHLLTGPELRRLSELGTAPVVVTVHNTREGWPAGFAELEPNDAALLVACSLAAEQDLVDAGLPITRRTIWNGIHLDPWRPSKSLAAAGRKMRETFGFGRDDVVLVALANPRPQKRLELLPPVLAAMGRCLSAMDRPRQAKLLFVGDKDPAVETAKRALDGMMVAARECGVLPDVRLAGSTLDVAPMLAAADALVSTSAHEGLSLAHLEALATGLPVFATDAGGTREIAFAAPKLEVFPRDVAPAAMGERMAEVLSAEPLPQSIPELASFSRETMAKRYAYTYRRTLARPSWQRAAKGLVLVTNNFSTGGAQSSARRLLVGLRDAGEYVRAAVLEEQPEWPTPGRNALVEAGIEVLALPEAGSVPVHQAVQKLFAWLDADPPETIIFWNALAPYKILIADQCLDARLFDVSPGEMFFASLQKYVTNARHRLDVPFRHARDYGARLSGIIVKYAAEAQLAAETLGAPTFVVPNGVPLPEKRGLRHLSDRLLLGTSARLSPQKKLEELIDAFRLALPRLPPCSLLVAGGPERGSEGYAESLKTRAEGLPVEWLGEVDVTTMLEQIDLFVMISEPAGCPNASLEAMAMGLPVIATDVGGASEQVLDGLSGRLIVRGDVPGFAAAMVELGHDRALREALGAGARRRIEERFDVRRMVADYRRIGLGR